MLLKQRGDDSVNNTVLKKQKRKGERVEEGGRERHIPQRRGERG